MCIWFQLVAASVLLTVRNTYRIQPFGFQMCQNLCHQIRGCSFLKFSSLHLDCDIADNGQKIEPGFKCTSCFEKTKKMKEEAFSVSRCSHGDLIIATKTKGRHCVKPRYMVDMTSVKRSSPRLLFGPTMKDRMGQLFLQNSSVVAYPYRQDVNLMSIIYISATQTLLVSYPSSRHIYTHSLNGSEHRIFLKNAAATSMAVDEEHCLVFLGDHGRIKRVKTNGTQLRAIYTIKIFVKAIAAYSKQKTLFVSVITHCFSSSYDGKNITIIKEGSDMFSIAVDTLNDLLYYNVGKDIIEMSMNTSIQHRIPVYFTPWSILFYGENLYIGLEDGRNTIGVLKGRREFVPIHNISKRKGNYYMCIIP